MFKFFRSHQPVQETKQPDFDSTLDIIAVMQGQINIQHVVISCLIDCLDQRQRDALIVAFKTALANRLSGDPQWLDENRKFKYNSTISGMLMALIEEAEKKPPQSN